MKETKNPNLKTPTNFTSSDHYSFSNNRPTCSNQIEHPHFRIIQRTTNKANPLQPKPKVGAIKDPVNRTGDKATFGQPIHITKFRGNDELLAHHNTERKKERVKPKRERIKGEDKGKSENKGRVHFYKKLLL